jgi:sugar phosphate isomerase/epimerase
MSNIADRLAVQSFCYRGFPETPALIEKITETGLAGVELCSRHVNFQNRDRFDHLIAQYDRAGIDIVSIGVCGMSTDKTRMHDYFQFAQKAGVDRMAVDFPVGAAAQTYVLAEALAERYDMRLMIHNHGGRHWLGNAQMLGQVFATTSERIGLVLDTAWAMHSHEDPLELIDRFGDRLYGLHLKDFVFDRAGNHEDVVVGTGNLDLEALDAKLDEIGFDGIAVLEYEGDVDNPVPALKDCVANIQARMGG